MLEYSTWLSRYANSIEDKSTFNKSNVVTEFQKRAYIADMLVPTIRIEADVDDWVTAFCVTVTKAEPGRKSVMSLFFADVVGKEMSHEYYKTAGDSESLAWLKKFKEDLSCLR